MSVQAVNMLLGPGRLFFKRTGDTDGKYKLVGSAKSAEFTYTPDYAEAKPGDGLGAVRRDRVDEKCSIKIEAVDFKIAEVLASLGLSVSTTQLTLTSSIRLTQEIQTVSSTTTKSFSQTPKSATSVQFTSLDRSTEYVKGTDWTGPTAKKYRALSAGFKNSFARAHYTKRFSTAKRLDVGDNLILEVVSLMYVHQKSNKKSVAVQIYRATVIGDFKLNFAEKDYTVREIMFGGLADPTLARGKKMFRIIEEQ